MLLVRQIQKAKACKHKSTGKYPGYKHSESCMGTQARCNFKYLELTITFKLLLGRWPQICLGFFLSLSLFFFFYNMFCLNILYAWQAHGHKYGPKNLKTSWIVSVLVIRHCGSPFPGASPLRICLIQPYPQCMRDTPNAVVRCLCRERAACFLIPACNGGKLFPSELSERVCL